MNTACLISHGGQKANETSCDDGSICDWGPIRVRKFDGEVSVYYFCGGESVAFEKEAMLEGPKTEDRIKTQLLSEHGPLKSLVSLNLASGLDSILFLQGHYACKLDKESGLTYSCESNVTCSLGPLQVTGHDNQRMHFCDYAPTFKEPLQGVVRGEM